MKKQEMQEVEEYLKDCFPPVDEAEVIPDFEQFKKKYLNCDSADTNYKK